MDSISDFLDGVANIGELVATGLLYVGFALALIAMFLHFILKLVRESDRNKPKQ